MNTKDFSTPDYSKVDLTDEEIKAALFEAQKVKFFRNKHAPYWNERDPDKKVKKSIDNSEK
jgi:hypothetical protein